jgi:hypothetical protein
MQDQEINSLTPRDFALTRPATTRADGTLFGGTGGVVPGVGPESRAHCYPGAMSREGAADFFNEPT